MTWPVDHIGIAVTDLNTSIAFYLEKFGFRLESREIIHSQGVEVAFIESENTLIELLAATNQTSPFAESIKKRGPGLHHICYRVENIRDEITRLKKQGIEFIDNEPRPGAHGKLIAFIRPKSTGGVLTELCEKVS